MLDMARAREAFEDSQDFTVGIEEEFQILDPDTLALSQRFEELYEAGRADDVLHERVAGELISSEIEIRSAKGDDFADALASQREARGRLFALAADHGIRLGATGTHPFSLWQEQRIIDTEHYRRLQRDLGYVARRNNTWSIHVHVGVRGADRAMAVCDRLRPVLPELPALRHPRGLGELDHVRELRRVPAQDRVDRRGHAALVERTAAPLVRDGR